MKQNKILILILSLFTVSCAIKNKVYKARYNGGIQKFIFMKNGEFKEYNVTAGFGFDTLQGQWSKRNDTIILKYNFSNVYVNNDSLSTVVEKIKPNISDKIIFEIKNTLGKKEGFSKVIINEKEFLANEKGVVVINKSVLKGNKILFVSSLISPVYKNYTIKNMESNYFEVVLDYRDLLSLPLSGIDPPTKYLIKGRKIISIGEKKYVLKRKYLR